MKAKKGDWVRIHSLVLEVGSRAANVPEDTAKVPLELWNKGFLLNDEAEIGDEVELESYIGRRLKGKLIEINPQWQHNYGDYVPELAHVGRQARQMLEEVDDNAR